MNEPNPGERLVATMRGMADDPDQREGALRDCLRSAASVVEKQHETIEVLAEYPHRVSRQFGRLAVMLAVIAAFEIARLFDWL